ncbi:DUF3320 domain-containing protein [Neorhizobium sp. P12A]|uniref:DUF3320 domain-containing protein n=1 Tax=Neorhizobium sp. P12A TaxID=2268027 RepID=UPI0032B2A210
MLFVAEKMAALEVVKRRLDQAGVGDACLELHSNKANKRALLADLQHVWDLGAPKGESGDALDRRLTEARDGLNAHPVRMHAVYQPYQLTPFQVIGHLSRLRRLGVPPSDIELAAATDWSPEMRDKVVTLLSELAERIKDISIPAEHPWYGIGLTGITPLDLDRLKDRLVSASADLSGLVAEMEVVTARLEGQPAASISDFKKAALLAARVATCPEGITSEALANTIWETDPGSISRAVLQGAEFAKLEANVDADFTAEAWKTDTSSMAAQFGRLPKEFSHSSFANAAKLEAVLPRFLNAAKALRDLLGVNVAPTVTAIERLTVVGQHVAEAPDASPDAFVAAIWERGLDQAGDLAEAVATFRRIQGELAGKVSDQAWDVDLTAARTAVAVHGGRLFRFLSGDWRKAKALLKTVMPETSPAETIQILDLLQKGKQARLVVKDGDSLGRSAFGADWRGERSDPKPLENLVLWMRSLRGFGAEARMIASRLTDRSAVAARSEQVRALLLEVRHLLGSLWDDLGEVGPKLFADAPGADNVMLTDASVLVREIAAADRGFSALARTADAASEVRLTQLQRLAHAQGLRAEIEGLDQQGRAAFGPQWRGAESDWMALAKIVDWISSNGDIRLLASRVDGRAELADAAARAEQAGDALAIRIEEILEFLKADKRMVLEAGNVVDTPLGWLQNKIDRWIANDEQLSKWAAYKGRSQDATEAGVGLIVERLADGRVPPVDVIPYFDMTYYEAVLKNQHQRDPELVRFDGEVHGRLVSEFATLDRSRMALSRLEVVRAHHRKFPPVMGIGPVGVLRGEMARRKGHMPIRQLMQRASPAIQALKPVFMMSPLSVAQFLPQGLLEFDMLVMDEASQIQPVDALGAVARAKQVVVVGDEKQLPPTRFFAKMTSGASDEEDDEDGARVSDIESILGLFSARGLPERMLRWHYRSRHQSLIAVSNSQFYESKLFIVPSSYTQEAGMGLWFNHVPGGVFDDGMNKVEAKVVAEAIIRHALEHPNLSLGVAAFSIKQRREIQDQLELLRRLNPQTEEFFHSHPSEPFFVKNLENVQGDERDVIFISVAYAKNAQGFMGMRFGPLGAEGGERRLNVLISRAKRRCEVYSSITDEDIDLEQGKGKGVFAFKLFLHYARTGRMSMSQRADRQMDSVFEEQVMAALQERGYQVHPQVGIAGFFIDLAVADEAVPGRYLVGIECDGAEYHSSRSARDRDRLRQAVLEDHGWTIHRVWSSDWFQRPKAELERLVAAIERAKADALTDPSGERSSTRAVPVEVVTIERADVTEIGLQNASDTKSAAAYKEAQLRPNIVGELHEAPIGTVVSLVKQTVEAEGPIHRDEVVTRIRSAWGLQRAGNRIDTHVGTAIAIAQSSGEVVRSDGGFLSWKDAPVFLRDRSGVGSLSLRRADMIPPSEIDQGLRDIIGASLGATADQAVNAVSRGLGFKATSWQLRDAILSRIDVLKKDGVLVEENAMLTVV